MNNNIILKVICLKHKHYNKIIKDRGFINSTNIEDWRNYLGRIYLHGNVEVQNGFDCVSLINYEDFNETFDETDSLKKTVRMTYIPKGIYKCKVYGYKNYCTAFIWRDRGKRSMGLIVDNNDTEHYEDALRKYNNNSSNI